MVICSKRFTAYAAVGALAALACQERQTTASAGAVGLPDAPPSASRPGVASMNSAGAPPNAPAPSASSSASSPGSAGPPVLPGFVVGRFSGKSSVYDAVVNERQTYSHRHIEIVVEAGGHFTTRLARGPQGQPADYRCEASGLLRLDGPLYRMEIATSTCRRAKAGSSVEFSLEQVGNCTVVWNRKKGSPPFEVEQVAVRKEGC